MGISILVLFSIVALCVYFILVTVVRDSTGYLYNVLEDLSRDLKKIKEKIGIETECELEIAKRKKSTSAEMLGVVKHLLLLVSLVILLHLLLQLWR
ncbi:MAG: hypothetical protein DRZ76_00225 [Candidatus Nealsonbacteria bacterium]|nr:MAG: hypothetical protein DRZ76_00225 [Candidatus Nealsonbacteria bacterium]